MFGRRFARRFFWGGPPPWAQYGPEGQWEQRRNWFSVEQQALRSTAMEVGRLFMIANRSSIGNPERQAQLRAFLERSRKELSDIIYGAEQASGTGGPSDGGQA